MADIPSLPDVTARMVDANGRPTTEWYLLLKKFYPLLKLANSAVQEIPPVDPDTLYSDVTDTLTVGFTTVSHNAGSVSSGTVTLDPALGALWRYNNAGAHTLAPPVGECTMQIMVFNASGAGAITTSGFTYVKGAFTTTPGALFLASVAKIGTVSLLVITVF